MHAVADRLHGTVHLTVTARLAELELPCSGTADCDNPEPQAVMCQDSSMAHSTLAIQDMCLLSPLQSQTQTLCCCCCGAASCRPCSSTRNHTGLHQHSTTACRQELYHNPEDLSPLQHNPRARMLAHSMIQHAMLEKQLETYRACTDTAKQLANVIESGQRTAVSTLLSAVRKLLPIPFLK